MGAAAMHHLRRGPIRATHPHHEGCITAVASGPQSHSYSIGTAPAPEQPAALPNLAADRIVK